MSDNKSGIPVYTNPRLEAQKKADAVREHAEWCKLPQSVRDSATNEDRGDRPHVRDTSCDKPKKGSGRH